MLTAANDVINGLLAKMKICDRWPLIIKCITPWLFETN
jgi:hypothetical protein